MTAGDRRSEVLSHKEVAKTGVFYLPKEAPFCKDIAGGICIPDTSITLNKNFTKVFIIEDGAKTVAGYSWELVAIDSPAGKKVYAFSGDLVEEKVLENVKTKTQSKLRNQGWVELTATAPDKDGFVGITLPTEAVGKKSISFHHHQVEAVRVNGGTPIPYNGAKGLSFPDPMESGANWLPDIKLTPLPSPRDKILAKFQ